MMDYESILLSACIKDIHTLKRARRADIAKHFFTDKFQKYLYNALCHLVDFNYYDLASIEAYIYEDKAVDDSFKHSCLEALRDISSLDSSNADFSYEILKSKSNEKEMNLLLNKAAKMVLAKEPVKEVFEEMSLLSGKIATSRVAYEAFSYYDGWQNRKAERVEVIAEEVKSLKFNENLRPFKNYFTRGISKEEITAIGGPTYAGKSIMLSNFINMATNPINGLNVIYVFAENRAIQALSRLDSIFLDRDYDNLFVSSNDFNGDKFFLNARQEGWGDLMAFKVTPGAFSVNDIRSMIEECKSRGFHPDVLAVDSPDHQISVKNLKDSWQIKGQVYWELKALAESEKLILLTSLPMKASSVKNSTPRSEDVAGSYDISRIVDNLILFNVNPDDAILGRVNLVVTKNREGRVDNKDIQFRVKNSLKVQPWEDFEMMSPEINYISSNGHVEETKFHKKKL
jgi:KaiC/GvpD/RAD55 family RecA-like ATPase